MGVSRSVNAFVFANETRMGYDALAVGGLLAILDWVKLDVAKVF